MNHKTLSPVLLLIFMAFTLSDCIHIGDATESFPPADFTQQPISTQVLDPLAALTGTPRPPSQDAGANQVTLDNQSNWDVCYVYIAQSTEPTWGNDRLDKNEEVAVGNSRVIAIQPGTYDLRAENCDFMRLDEQSNVTISSDYSWQVNDPNEIFYEDFKGDTSRWVSPNPASGKSAVADSALSLTATQNNAIALETYPQSVQNSINVVEAIAPEAALGDSSAYGLMCRAQANGDGYLFLVRSDEQFSIQKVSGGQWTPLADWQSNPDKSYYKDYNVLEITCNNTALSLRFNGLTLVKANDSDFTDGNFGIAAVTFTGNPASYTFNNLAVIEP